MTPENIQRALFILHVEKVKFHDTHLGVDREISKPLAALIEAVSLPLVDENGEWCHACGRDFGECRADCALVRLVDAINGET